MTSIAVVGAGAVGCYFGGMLARAGQRVTLIGRRSHVDAIAGEGLLLERLGSQERVRVDAATEIAAVRGARLVLVCVKTVDTENVARALQAHLGAQSSVLSLQNGVDNVERMREAAQVEAIPAVVYVAAAMAGPGHVKHSGRGDLIVGHLPGNAAVARGPRATDLEELARQFESAQIPCRVSADIRTELWTKMMLNCAYNAISALGRARYERLIRSAEIRDLMKHVVEETLAVAHAEGVPLSATAALEATYRLGEAMPNATSSTAQDIARGRPTEIDSLNGLIVRRGRALGVPTPVNLALHTLVKLLEQVEPR